MNSKENYQNSILIDTNILLFLVIGSVDEKLITKIKRTNTFTINEFKLLLDFIKPFSNIVVTPKILTEVSNLLGHLPRGKNNMETF